MRIFKILISITITLVLVYGLNNRWVIGSSPIPPLGKFLNPFEGFWQNATNDALPYNSSVNLEGLKAAVTVQYDSQFIPHLFAENKEDLFMAQGYIIAQHRLWQMDFQSYAAAGRISELIGKNALNFDRLQRRKGMVFGANKSLEEMKKDKRLWNYVEKYTSGVNQYINSLSYKELPLEYKLLDYKPEPWTPLKAALLIQYMSDNLTGWDEDLENTNAYNLFGKEAFELMFPNYSAEADPVVPSPEQWPFENIITPKTPDSLTIADTFMKTVHEMPDPDNGSNNWVVAGWKTKSGKPILSSDMHLGLNLPSLWFLIELSAPDYHVMGFALTGNIGIVSGFNEHNAWAFTDVTRDERDWYKIEFTDESRSSYHFDNDTQLARREIEEISIRNGETYYDTVVYTHHGPIVYDHAFPGDEAETNMALKWIGHEPSRVQQALMGLNESSNYEEYVKALDYWDAPAQHVAFASTSGDIAIRVQGLWPNKFKNQGLFIMDGSDPALEWQAFIPTNHYAFQHNPDRGFVSSANQQSVDENYPYWQGWGNADFYRSRRINNILSAYDSASVTPEDMMQLQLDDYGILPEEILPLLLDSLTANKSLDESDSLLQALRKWDYHYKAEKIAPVAFISWWKNFKLLLWDEMGNEELALNRPTDFHTTKLFKEGIPLNLVDYKNTEKVESLSDIVAMSYDSMKLSLSNWMENSKLPLNWGNYKHTSVIHLARIPALSRMNLTIDGEDDVVNSTKPNHGPSQRIVIEMTSPPKAWAIIPGGQSGNPGNPAYDNMVDMYRKGEYFKLNFMTGPTENESIIFNQTFNPANQ